MEGKTKSWGTLHPIELSVFALYLIWELFYKTLCFLQIEKRAKKEDFFYYRRSIHG